MESVEDYKILKEMNFKDNFISENSEKILIELMEKNHNLIKLDLHGNRISLSCLSRVQKFLKRNVHDYDFKEPNRLNNQVFRLQFERDKVDEARRNIEKLQKDIDKIQLDKNSLVLKLETLRTDEKNARKTCSEKIEFTTENIAKRQSEYDARVADYEEVQGKFLKDQEAFNEKINAQKKIKEDLLEKSRILQENHAAFEAEKESERQKLQAE